MIRINLQRDMMIDGGGEPEPIVPIVEKVSPV